MIFFSANELWNYRPIASFEIDIVGEGDTKSAIVLRCRVISCYIVESWLLKPFRWPTIFTQPRVELWLIIWLILKSTTASDSSDSASLLITSRVKPFECVHDELPLFPTLTIRWSDERQLNPLSTGFFFIKPFGAFNFSLKCFFFQVSLVGGNFAHKKCRHFIYDGWWKSSLDRFHEIALHIKGSARNCIKEITLIENW